MQHDNKIDIQVDSSTEVTFVESITQRPSLDVIGNNLLAKHGIASVQWLRYFQAHGESKWVPVAEQDMQAYRDKRSLELRSTCTTSYAVDDENEPLTAPEDTYYLSDWVWFDIDCDTPDEAIRQAHKFVRRLEATDLDLRCLQLFASGKKGFHVLVPLGAFVDEWWDTLRPQEMRDFPLICKAVAYGLYEDGVDLRVYSQGRGRQLREANVQRDIGTYKVSLTLDEFWGITPELYAQFVSAPRPDAPDPVPVEVNYALADIWDQGAAACERDSRSIATIRPEVTEDLIARVSSLVGVFHPDESEDLDSCNALRTMVAQVLRFELGHEAGLPVMREFAKKSRNKNGEFFKSREWSQIFNSTGKTTGRVTTLGTLIAFARERNKGWEDKWQHLNPRNQVESPQYRLKETDEGFAEHVAAVYSDRLRYVSELKTWMAFDGRSWVPEYGISTAKDLAKKEARAHAAKVVALQPSTDAEEGARKKSLGFTVGLENGKKLENIVSKMADDPRLLTSVGLFDDMPYLLNLANGTYDLLRDEMRGHEADDYLTQRMHIARDPNAKCPRWLRFVDEITQGNEDLATYLQCIAGLCLSGDVSKQEAYILWGSGANGKSVFTGIIRELCGDYFKPLNVDVLVYSNKPGQNTTEMAALRGARAVSTSELERGVQLRSGNFKDLTGGDAMQVSDKYVKAFTLKPQCTILIPTNFLPTIMQNDNGTWRRICILPFAARFEGSKRDPRLMEKLKAELPGILNWAIEGFRKFKGGEMHVPLCVQELTLKYRDELNIIKNFVDQWLVQDDAGRSDPGRIKLDDLYVMYQLFCKANGLRSAMTKRMFREDVGEYLPDQTMQARQPIYQGWRILAEYVPENVLTDRFSKEAHAAKSLQYTDEVDD